MPQQAFPHIPHKKEGFDCPRPTVTIPLDTVRGTTPIQFVLDTGADLSLIPCDLADALQLEYEDSPLPLNRCPRTLHGRLPNCFVTEVRATFLGRDLRLPVVVYTPVLAPAPSPAGPPGMRRRERRISSMEEYLSEVEHNENGDDEPSRPPVVLGRLGFLNRYHVLIGDKETLVSTDPLGSTERRGCLSFLWPWKS